MIDQEKVKQAVKLLLEGIGEDITREGRGDGRECGTTFEKDVPCR